LLLPLLYSQRTGASGTLDLSKGKKARPSNLPPFLPFRTLSSIDSEGEDRMDSEGNSPAAHLTKGMECEKKEGKAGRKEGERKRGEASIRLFFKFQSMPFTFAPTHPTHTQLHPNRSPRAVHAQGLHPQGPDQERPPQDQDSPPQWRHDRPYAVPARPAWAGWRACGDCTCCFACALPPSLLLFLFSTFLL